MANPLPILGGLSVQDRDLLERLGLYFDNLEEFLAEGRGWFIFGLAGQRLTRVSKFIFDRLVDYQPLVSFYVAPWRDFALNAYMHEVELATKPEESHQGPGVPERIRREYDIASRVSRDTYYVMSGCDLLVVTGLSPSYLHELQFLEKVSGGRFDRRHPTILLSPKGVVDLSSAFEAVDPSKTFWDRLFRRMYESSLIAV